MKRWMPGWVRSVLSIGVVAVTAVVFVYFFATHPHIIDSLKQVSPWVIVWLLLLYGVMALMLTVISDYTLRLCGHRLRPGENLLLTTYSSIVNFFGPLQSGPGFRAVYLKKRHGVSLRDYTLASLIYYAFFAVCSAGFLLLGLATWWLAIGGIALVIAVCYLVIRRTLGRAKAKGQAPRLVLSASNLGGLAATTLIQVVLVAVIYFIELRVINDAITFRQAAVYTGAANFALFVSLTPGAIGFRESFLVFSKGLHYISTAIVLAASLVDRAVYVVFLALAFVAVALFHGTTSLQIRRSSK